ncbi:MAG: lmo0937 family membrane protein [Crocinitomicaceae bacterium]|nr:lmo0937 family membrane protein [Crocinitomicaceae bacterium]
MRESNSFSGTILYTIAIILVTIWAIAYFGYNSRDMVHALLVIALVIVLFRIMRGSFKK